MFPIIRALSLGKWEIADYILAQGIDINRRDNYGCSIFRVACSGFAPVRWVSRMIDPGGNVHDRWRRETPIFNSVRGEATAVMDLLLARGADVNAIDTNGNSPLVNAARGGKWESAKWLIAHGADLRHCAHRDQDALYWARQNGHPQVEELLLLALGIE